MRVLNIAKWIIRFLAYPFVSVYFFIKPLRVKVKSLDDTISLLTSGRKSIVRFGDGEIKLINGSGIYFQDYDETLSKILSDILQFKNNDFLVGVMDVFNGLPNLVLTARVFWKFNLFIHRKEYELLQDREWANSFISRPYMDYKDKNKKDFFASLQSLWENRDVIFIEGTTTRNGVGNDLYTNAKSIRRIICPAKNAFSVYNDLVAYINNSISRDCLLLISLGPTAKVVSYELFNLGFQIMDLGHLDSEYEWFLAKSKRKTKILGKHTAEDADESVPNCTNSSYISQIIKRFE